MEKRSRGREEKFKREQRVEKQGKSKCCREKKKREREGRKG